MILRIVVTEKPCTVGSSDPGNARFDGNGFTDLFPVVKTFIVVVALGNTFPLSLIAGGVCVHDVTGQEILPEGKALRR